MPPKIDATLCTGCGTCARICPTQVFRFTPQIEVTPHICFAEECWHCDSCVLDCPVKAVSLRIPLPYMMLHVDAASLKPDME